MQGARAMMVDFVDVSHIKLEQSGGDARMACGSRPPKRAPPSFVRHALCAERDELLHEPTLPRPRGIVQRSRPVRVCRVDVLPFPRSPHHLMPEATLGLLSEAQAQQPVLVLLAEEARVRVLALHAGPAAHPLRQHGGRQPARKPRPQHPRPSGGGGSGP
eukprot:scaffold216005_cov30-Tisochrysis_lutea.AAC.2